MWHFVARHPQSPLLTKQSAFLSGNPLGPFRERLKIVMHFKLEDQDVSLDLGVSRWILRIFLHVRARLKVLPLQRDFKGQRLVVNFCGIADCEART